MTLLGYVSKNLLRVRSVDTTHALTYAAVEEALANLIRDLDKVPLGGLRGTLSSLVSLICTFGRAKDQPEDVKRLLALVLRLHLEVVTPLAHMLPDYVEYLNERLAPREAAFQRKLERIKNGTDFRGNLSKNISLAEIFLGHNRRRLLPRLSDALSEAFSDPVRHIDLLREAREQYGSDLARKEALDVLTVKVHAALEVLPSFPFGNLRKSLKYLLSWITPSNLAHADLKPLQSLAHNVSFLFHDIMQPLMCIPNDDFARRNWVIAGFVRELEENLSEAKVAVAEYRSDGPKAQPSDSPTTETCVVAVIADQFERVFSHSEMPLTVQECIELIKAASQDRLQWGDFRLTQDLHRSGSTSAVVKRANLVLPPLSETQEHSAARKLRSDVAVKRLASPPTVSTEELRQNHARETSLLRSLRHPNIVELIGSSFDAATRSAWIVFPWATHGDVHAFLRRRSTGAAEIDAKNALLLLAQVTEGLCYLHNRTPPVRHGNLKAENVVVGNSSTEPWNVQAALCGFGMARVLDKSAYVGSNATISEGSVRWSSPEVLCGRPKSIEDDMWAWAWLAWELITGEIPFHHISDIGQVICAIVADPPNVPIVELHPAFRNLNTLAKAIRCCWTPGEESRIAITECMDAVKKEVVALYLQPHPNARPVSLPGISEDQVYVRALHLWSDPQYCFKSRATTPTPTPTSTSTPSLSRQPSSGLSRAPSSSTLASSTLSASRSLSTSRSRTRTPLRRQTSLVLARVHSDATDCREDPITGRLINTANSQELFAKPLFTISSERSECTRQLRQVTLACQELTHRYLHPIVGHTMRNSQLLILTPWCTGGNLRQYIDQRTPGDPYQILQQIAEALAHLHQLSPPRPHGSIKPENVLFNEHGEAVLSEAGLAEECRKISIPYGKPVDVRYMAPEILRGSRHSPAGDIYSFGCLACELLTGRAPFSSRATIGMVAKAKMSGLPPWPETALPSDTMLWKFLRWCLDEESERRPSAQRLVDAINEAVQSEEGSLYDSDE